MGCFHKVNQKKTFSSKKVSSISPFSVLTPAPGCMETAKIWRGDGIRRICYEKLYAQEQINR